MGETAIRRLRHRLRQWLAASIYNRIAMAALSMTMIVAVVTGVTSFGVVAVLVQRSIHAELNGQARLTLQKLQDDLKTFSGDIATMASNSFIANGLVDSFGRDTYLLPFLREHNCPVPFHITLVLCDFRGRPIASNDPTIRLPDGAQSAIDAVLADGRPQAVLLQAASGRSLLLVQPVIFPPTGQAEGVLVATVSLQELFSSETGHLDGYSLRLLTRGSAVAHGGVAGLREKLVRVQHPLVLTEPLHSLHFSFEIGLPRGRVEGPLHLLALVYLLCGLSILALVIKFSRETAKRLTRPLISLSTTASRIAASGSLEFSTDISGSDEVGTLASVFNDMLKKLRTSHEHLESQVAVRTRELQEARDLLEIRVAQRTAQLTETNLRLEQEIETTSKLEQQLRQVQKMEAIGTLAGGIAHDFNNILTVIGSYSAMTSMQMNESDPLKKNVDQIMAATEKAANLTRSLLAFSRKQIMTPQDADLNVIVRHVEKFLLRVIGEDIHLDTDYHEGPVPVHVDSGQFEQILMNLATNARDAMPRGGSLKISTRIESSAPDDLPLLGNGPVAVLRVADSGCGMEQATVRKIFEPFYSTKEVGKGTGLGLAMVYGIVQQHNGHISVQSEPGRGTTFTIYLPAVTIPVYHLPSPPVNDSGVGGNETILVAEDDAEIRAVVQQILSGAGYRVILAVDGQDAVEKFSHHVQEISLVLLDMIMPRKSGKDACTEIRELAPEVKVLFASGYAPDLIKSRGALDDGAEIVMKPVPPPALLRKVREMLDRQVMP